MSHRRRTLQPENEGIVPPCLPPTGTAGTPAGMPVHCRFLTLFGETSRKVDVPAREQGGLGDSNGAMTAGTGPHASTHKIRGPAKIVMKIGPGRPALRFSHPRNDLIISIQNCCILENGKNSDVFLTLAEENLEMAMVSFSCEIRGSSKVPLEGPHSFVPAVHWWQDALPGKFLLGGFCWNFPCMAGFLARFSRGEGKCL